LWWGKGEKHKKHIAVTTQLMHTESPLRLCTPTNLLSSAVTFDDFGIFEKASIDEAL